MRTLARYALTIGVALLAGCGGSQPLPETPGVTPQSRAATAHANRGASWMLPVADRELVRASYKIKPPLLYATNVGNTNVTVYRASAKDPGPLATIPDGITNPFGACIDSQGTLYITNEPASAGWISVYTLGKTTPSRIITDGISWPAYCTIDRNGNLWVANASGPNVTEYLRGSKKPHTVITKGLVEPVGIAIDGSGNLFVGNGVLGSQQNVEVYAPGSESPSRTITNGVTSPCGLAVDSNGTLYVANVFQNNVEEYRSGQGDPFQTITKAMNHPEGVSVDKKGTLYVSNVGNSTIVKFALGSLNPLNRKISKKLYEPESIAYYPPLLP